eukprot:gene3215-4027_t
MRSVLVLGTGFIGYNVCLAFLNSGWKVYGMTRSTEKADSFMRNEITPIISDINSIENWKSIAEEVDVIIEALSDSNNPKSTETALRVIKQVVAKRPQTLVIYTSGTWVYGNRGNHKIVTETTEYKPLIFAVEKVELEKEYLSLGAVIIQPTELFGSSGAMTDDFFKQVVENEDGVVRLYGPQDQYIPFIHTLDLARAYVLAVEKSYLSRGQVFIISAPNERLSDTIKSIGEAAGKPNIVIERLEPHDDYTRCLAISSRVSAEKANKLLGWYPCQPSIIDDPLRYLNAWRYNTQSRK